MKNTLTQFSENRPFLFECQPASVRCESNRLCAWLQCGGDGDVVAARWLGQYEPPTVLSSSEATAGAPQLAAGGGVRAAWEWCKEGTWGVSARRWFNGCWGETVIVARGAFDPALTTDSAGDVWCARIEMSNSRRSLIVSNLDSPETPAIAIPTAAAPIYRPNLCTVGSTLWVTWETYLDDDYRLCACSVERGEADSPITVSDGPGWDILHTSLSTPSGDLWLAWVHSQDVEDSQGVVDQWPSIEAARLVNGQWQRLPRAADLCHGLLPKTAVWGYLGQRRDPMLVRDGERVWVVWERKATHDGATWEAPGVLCGCWLDGGSWSPERELHRGLVGYIVDSEAAVCSTPAHTSATGGRLGFVARDMLAKATWSSGVKNVHESAWMNLVAGEIDLRDELKEFGTEVWTGWRAVRLADRRAKEQRRSIQLRDERLTLFWGDPHVHTVQSGDAEGEVDELLHYARDKAKLDFCAVNDNDVYCFPLTDHEWARQQRFIDEHTEEGQFVVVPGYEWSWADPSTGTPNHRLALFAELNEPLRRQTDDGGKDIVALARSIENTSGILIGHHLGWQFADSPVEAAIEVVSAWSPHIVLKPDFIHDVLNTGRRLGFTGGSDSHRRNPGFCGALTGVYSNELSAAAIVGAIWKRRTVATTGTMIAVELWVGGAFIGGEVELRGPVPIVVRARSPRPIESLAVVRDGDTIKECNDVSALEVDMEFDDTPASGIHWYYARVKLYDDVPNLPSNVVAAEGSHAWTSPVWLEALS